MVVDDTVLLCYYYWDRQEFKMMNRPNENGSEGGVFSNGALDGTQKGAAIACANM